MKPSRMNRNSARLIAQVDEEVAAMAQVALADDDAWLKLQPQLTVGTGSSQREMSRVH